VQDDVLVYILHSLIKISTFPLKYCAVFLIIAHFPKVVLLYLVPIQLRSFVAWQLYIFLQIFEMNKTFRSYICGTR
jgi:hypothetical protein